MFEILSFIFGGVFRLLPEFTRLWDQQKAREHELSMLELNMRLDEQRAKLAMQTAELQGNIQQSIEELRAIVEATKSQAMTSAVTGNKFVDALMAFADFLSKLVRPVLTYWYCIAAYGAYKTASYILIMESGATWQNAVTLLWTPQDHAVMLSIIGFWFVDRAIRKVLER